MTNPYKIFSTTAYSFLALFVFAQFIPLTSNNINIYAQAGIVDILMEQDKEEADPKPGEEPDSEPVEGDSETNTEPIYTPLTEAERRAAESEYLRTQKLQAEKEAADAEAAEDAATEAEFQEVIGKIMDLNNELKEEKAQKEKEEAAAQAIQDAKDAEAKKTADAAQAIQDAKDAEARNERLNEMIKENMGAVEKLLSGEEEQNPFEKLTELGEELEEHRDRLEQEALEKRRVESAKEETEEIRAASVEGRCDDAIKAGNGKFIVPNRKIIEIDCDSNSQFFDVGEACEEARVSGSKVFVSNLDSGGTIHIDQSHSIIREAERRIGSKNSHALAAVNARLSLQNIRSIEKKYEEQQAVEKCIKQKAEDAGTVAISEDVQKVFNCEEVKAWWSGGQAKLLWWTIPFWNSNNQELVEDICEDDSNVIAAGFNRDGKFISKRGPDIFDSLRSGKVDIQDYRLLEKNSPLSSIADTTGTVNPKTGFGELISKAAIILGGIAGMLAFVFFSTGAFLYVYGGFIGQAAGESSHIQKGKELMLNAVIGLVLILASYIILSRINVTLLNPNIKFDTARQLEALKTAQPTTTPTTPTPDSK